MNFKMLNCISLNKFKYFLGNEIAVISMPVVKAHVCTKARKLKCVYYESKHRRCYA